ncbi:MAG: SDR family oxidoreductase [bacterium]|nr:SDR family oxidoreductase [bacterium]
MDLKNKTVIITGASSGIGYAESKLLAQKGALVACFDLQSPKEPVAGVTYHQLDITDSGAIKKALATIKKPIDVLINNAGVMRRGTVTESSEPDYDLIMNVHMKASWLMFKLVQPKLINSAVILQMSSRHGLNLPPDPALYGLAKSASYHLAEIIQKTFPHYRVKIACPGPVDTPLSRYGTTKKEYEEKRKMMLTPDELAKHLVKLITADEYKKLVFDQDKSAYIFE